MSESDSHISIEPSSPKSFGIVFSFVFFIVGVYPLINSESVWKSHALHLMAEYFYSKNEKQKSKEFFSQIITLENANQDLKIEAQKRLNRDLSE